MLLDLLTENVFKTLSQGNYEKRYIYVLSIKMENLIYPSFQKSSFLRLSTVKHLKIQCKGSHLRSRNV